MARLTRFEKNLEREQVAIDNFNIDPLTKITLKNQLTQKTAAIRVFGSSTKGTIFRPEDLQRIDAFTGFLSGEGFKLGSSTKFIDPLSSIVAKSEDVQLALRGTKLLINDNISLDSIIDSTIFLNTIAEFDNQSHYW